MLCNATPKHVNMHSCKLNPKPQAGWCELALQCARVPILLYVSNSLSLTHAVCINSSSSSTSSSAVICYFRRLTCLPYTGFPFFSVFSSFNCFISTQFTKAFDVIQPHSSGSSLCYCPFNSAFQYLKCAIPAGSLKNMSRKSHLLSPDTFKHTLFIFLYLMQHFFIWNPIGPFYFQ